MTFLKNIFNALFQEPPHVRLEREYHKGLEAGNQITYFWPQTSVLIIDKNDKTQARLISRYDQANGAATYSETNLPVQDIVKILYVNIVNNAQSLLFLDKYFETPGATITSATDPSQPGNPEIATILWERSAIERTIRLLERDADISVADPVFTSFKQQLATEIKMAHKGDIDSALDTMAEQRKLEAKTPVEVLSAADAGTPNDSKKIAQKAALNQLVKPQFRN